MHLCSTLLFRILLVKILLLGVLLCLPRSLDAEEGGSRLYVPGAYSSLLNITPNKPGVAVGDAFIFTKEISSVIARLRSAVCLQVALTQTFTSRGSVLSTRSPRPFSARTTPSRRQSLTFG